MAQHRSHTPRGVARPAWEVRLDELEIRAAAAADAQREEHGARRTAAAMAGRAEPGRSGARFAERDCARGEHQTTWMTNPAEAQTMRFNWPVAPATNDDELVDFSWPSQQDLQPIPQPIPEGRSEPAYASPQPRPMPQAESQSEPEAEREPEAQAEHVDAQRTAEISADALAAAQLTTEISTDALAEALAASGAGWHIDQPDAEAYVGAHARRDTAAEYAAHESADAYEDDEEYGAELVAEYDDEDYDEGYDEDEAAAEHEPATLTAEAPVQPEAEADEPEPAQSNPEPIEPELLDGEPSSAIFSWRPDPVPAQATPEEPQRWWPVDEPIAIRDNAPPVYRARISGIGTASVPLGRLYKQNHEPVERERHLLRTGHPENERTAGPLSEQRTERLGYAAVGEAITRAEAAHGPSTVQAAPQSGRRHFGPTQFGASQPRVAPVTRYHSEIPAAPAMEEPAEIIDEADLLEGVEWEREAKPRRRTLIAASAAVVIGAVAGAVGAHFGGASDMVARLTAATTGGHAPAAPTATAKPGPAQHNASGSPSPTATPTR